jgi:hypothetical protein
MQRLEQARKLKGVGNRLKNTMQDVRGAVWKLKKPADGQMLLNGLVGAIGALRPASRHVDLNRSKQ